MTEFKQIIGRGTRLFDSKEFFTIYDFVDAYKHISDSEWDGEPLEPEPRELESYPMPDSDAPPVVSGPDEQRPQKKRVKVKLRDGKEREIKHMVSNSFWSADDKPISAEEFLSKLFGEYPPVG